MKMFGIVSMLLLLAASGRRAAPLSPAEEIAVMRGAVKELLNVIKSVRQPTNHSDERFVFEQRELEDMDKQLAQFEADVAQNKTIVTAPMQARLQHIREVLETRKSVVSPELTHGVREKPVERSPGAADGGYAPFYEGHYGKHKVDAYGNVINNSQIQRKVTLRRKAKLDINQKVYVENSPVLGDGAGDGALGKCREFTDAHVANPAAPTVTVCGTGIKATVFLRGRCEGYYEHSVTIGECNQGQPPSTCASYSPANKAAFGHYQSYKIEQC
jgi:hypothetical protein